VKELELVRQEMRQHALDEFKYVRTCVLARELCLLVRSSRAFLNVEDVFCFCSFIARLCREAGCKEASDLCAEAAEAAVKDEERHLELCEQSCTLCHDGRFPAELRRKEPPT
jgi:hypothetical protein